MAAQQLARLKARSEATCDRLQGDIFAIRQQKVPQGFLRFRSQTLVQPVQLRKKAWSVPNGSQKNRCPFELPGSIKADSCSHLLFFRCGCRATFAALS